MGKITRTYSEAFKPTDFIWELSKEAGMVYTASLNKFWEVWNNEHVWLSKFDLQKRMHGVISRKLLHSDSFLAAMQQVHDNLNAWKEARKVDENAKPPSKAKFHQPVYFKKSQIRYVDGNIILSLGRDSAGEKQYLKKAWATSLPMPIGVQIEYNKNRGWRIHFILEFEVEPNDKEGLMTIDLGVKRIGTMFDGTQVVTISGKEFMALAYYENKINAENQRKLSNKKRGSRRKNKLKKAIRIKRSKLQNKKKDLLHKASRLVVDYAEANGIGKIVFGDCAGVKNQPDKSTDSNRMIVQSPEQQFRHYIEEKFSGISDITSEAYTSRRCPSCKHTNNHSTQGRVYECDSCKFIYDRDGVGALGIYDNVLIANAGCKSVDGESLLSFGLNAKRIRALAAPVGVKMTNQLSLGTHMLFMKSNRNKKRSVAVLNEKERFGKSEKTPGSLNTAAHAA